MFLVLLLGTTFQLDLSQSKHFTIVVTLEMLWENKTASLLDFSWELLQRKNAHICNTDCIKGFKICKTHTVITNPTLQASVFKYPSASVAH